MTNSPVAVIHVWRDYNGPSDCPYSVSLCDSDGHEITCDGGNELSAAWAWACELADEHGVPAKQIAESGEVLDIYEPDPATKDDVDSRSWETVVGYVSTFSNFPNGDEDGAADVEVQIGSAGVGQCKRWFIHTQDDAGGSDEADDTAYNSEREAREAGEEFAEERNEAESGEDAEDYLRRQTEDRVGDVAPNGRWCVCTGLPRWMTRGRANTT